MLTGRPPFKGATSLDTLLQVLHEEPVRPEPAAAQAASRCRDHLSEMSGERPGPPLCQRLRAGRRPAPRRRGDPIEARPVGVLERGWKWARRRPASAALVAGIVLVTLLGFTGVTWQWRVAVGRGTSKKSSASRPVPPCITAASPRVSCNGESTICRPRAQPGGMYPGRRSTRPPRLGMVLLADALPDGAVYLQPLRVRDRKEAWHSIPPAGRSPRWSASRPTRKANAANFVSGMPCSGEVIQRGRFLRPSIASPSVPMANGLPWAAPTARSGLGHDDVSGIMAGLPPQLPP